MSERWNTKYPQGISLQSTYFAFSLHSVSSISARGSLSSSLGSGGLSLPHSSELIGVLGYHDLSERYTGSISILATIHSRATAIREIGEGAKQEFRKDKRQGEMRSTSKRSPRLCCQMRLIQSSILLPKTDPRDRV